MPLTGLRRPRLLIEAADFRARGAAVRRGPRGWPSLLAREQDLDDERRAKASTYSAARHVEALAALMQAARVSMRPEG